MSQQRSTPTCNSLEEVREGIDRIDRQMVALMAEREGYVLQAARFKKTIEDVVVPERIEQIVKKVRAQAGELGATPMVAERTYRTMIDAFCDVERDQHRALHGNK